MNLGMQLERVTNQDFEKQGVKNANGLLVCSISINSIAHAAGLDYQDIILSVDGKEINSPEELNNLFDGKEIGEKLKSVYIKTKKIKL